MSPRFPESNQIRKEIKRQKIIQAATGLFAHKGLAATRMQDIASAAGISAGLAYHYFPAKTDIFHELVKQAIYTSQNVYQAALDLPGTGYQRLESLLRSMLPLAYGEQGIDQFLLIIQALTSDDTPVATQALFGGGLTGLTGRLVPIFEQGHLDGSIRAGSAAAQVGILASILQGLAVLACLPDGRSQWFPAASDILSLFRKAEGAAHD